MQYRLEKGIIFKGSIVANPPTRSKVFLLVALALLFVAVTYSGTTSAEEVLKQRADFERVCPTSVKYLVKNSQKLDGIKPEDLAWQYCLSVASTLENKTENKKMERVYERIEELRTHKRS